MARLHVALVLVFVAVSAVIVSGADNDKPASTTIASDPNTEGPTDEVGGDPNTIGTTEDDAADPPSPGDDDVAVAGPIGNDSSYANYPPAQETSGSGATVTLGFVSVAATTVGSLFLF